MLPQKFLHKILWLASYPKSGNTWFRAFLSALINDGKVEINNMKANGLFSSRETFDLATDISSRDLYDEEAKLMMTGVYRYVTSGKDSLSIIKVHDAFECDLEGRNIIPEDVTHCALYFIRNPLDIAGSLANHINFSMQDAVNMLTSNEACMEYQPNNLNKSIQFRQHLSDWSDHVNSWTLKPSFPVCVIRYEDMLADTFDAFNKALNFIGWQYSSKQIEQAIAATTFEELSKQETEKGFREKARKSPKFFRAGTMGNWEKELNKEQISRIISMNKDTMIKYRYI